MQQYGLKIQWPGYPPNTVEPFYPSQAEAQTHQATFLLCVASLPDDKKPTCEVVPILSTHGNLRGRYQ